MFYEEKVTMLKIKSKYYLKTFKILQEKVKTF